MQTLHQNIKPTHILVEKMTSGNMRPNTMSTNAMLNTMTNMMRNTMPMDMTTIKNNMGVSGTCDTINAQSNVLPNGCMCKMNKSWQLMPNGMYSCQ